jgi:predicted YcjX-like family ATPase
MLYADYLRRCAEAGLRFLQPGRLLTPGELRGAPVLRFCPLSQPGGPSTRDSLHAVFTAKYREYQEKVVRAFYRRHFAGIDRQVVLVDVLKALNDGPEAFDDMCAALAAILQSFHYGESGLLDWLTGRKIDRVLFAASKADHVVRSDRLHLANLLRHMLNVLDESNRIKAHAGIDVAAIAAIRCTSDVKRRDTGREVLQGTAAGESETMAFEPGAIPLDFPPPWDEFRYRFWDFQPRPDPAWRFGGFPNIGLPEALNCLLGDRLS